MSLYHNLLSWFVNKSEIVNNQSCALVLDMYRAMF